MLSKVLAIVFCFNIIQGVFAQDDHLKDLFEQHRARMQKILEVFDRDSLDSFFDESDFDAMSDMGLFGKSQTISIEQINENDGTISVFITPKDKNTKLDIKTQDGQIRVSSETKVDETTNQDGHESRSYSVSSFSQVIPIPENYQALGPQMLDQKIKISLVPKNGVNKVKQVQKADLPAPDKEPILKELNPIDAI